MTDSDRNFSTDWDEYYSDPFPATKFTRQISSHRVRKLMTTYASLKNLRVAELGGGNSFIAEDIITMFGVREYHVVDSNPRSLQLLSERLGKFSCVTSKLGDVTELEGECNFDIVFSIGLIEHFSREKSKLAIRSHFRMCKPGGIVIITFPTPTVIYRTIRRVAELFGVWKFFDERPLRFREVLAGAGDNGQLIHKSILWSIGLTQGYVVYRSEMPGG